MSGEKNKEEENEGQRILKAKKEESCAPPVLVPHLTATHPLHWPYPFQGYQ